MRKSTVLWLVLAAFCGAALFHTSQRVHDSGEKLAALSDEVGREEESIRVLQAEWSYLNQPQRLEKLAKQYLKLVPMKGALFVKADDIALRPAAVEAPVIDTSKYPLPEAEATLPARHEGTQAAVLAKPHTASRKFGDVMKSLGVDP